MEEKKRDIGQKKRKQGMIPVFCGIFDKYQFRELFKRYSINIFFKFLN